MQSAWLPRGVRAGWILAATVALLAHTAFTEPAPAIATPAAVALGPGGHLSSKDGGPVLTAKLDYGTFHGAYSAEYNITYWRTLPYAAPPIGRNRFRAPQPPVQVRGEETGSDPGSAAYDCSRPFPMCPQRETNGTEDCLYLGLYGRPRSAGQQQPLRPVVVAFYGGGFIRGSAVLGLPPSGFPVLNVSSSAGAEPAEDLLFVYPNYRSNAFGFLAGQQVGADPFSDANAGLLDQQAALRWVQKYIHAFGGDRGNVTIWGQSAGGGSVVAQVVAQAAAQAATASKKTNSTEQPAAALFHQAMASSPYWPKTYRYDAPETQRIYDDLVRRVGCSNASSASTRSTSTRSTSTRSNATDDGTLACLKAADVQVIRAASQAMTADFNATATSSYVWAPVVDDAFLRQPLSEVVQAAKKVPGHDRGLAAAFATYNTHEGENFVPRQMFPHGGRSDSGTGDGNALFHDWLTRYMPDLTAGDVAQIDRLYPADGDTDDDNDDKKGTESPSGQENSNLYAAYAAGDAFGRAGLVYRDAVLACPAYWLAGLAAGNNGTRGWLAQYAIPPARHASDTYWWNTVNAAQRRDPLHYRGYAGALASFFAAGGDPNARKLTNASVPGLPPISTGEEWTITPGGFDTRKLGALARRCAFWLSAAPRAKL